MLAVMESVLEYTWAEDVVRFELYPKPESCPLVMIEKISAITKWKKRYEEYRNAVNNV
ncbi:hypothetical protein [Cohnella luojiensis]|uniref:hypothetical protein n=1 Tax=Cohnella luojiensis TaxID=652876 RepID=UPI00196A85CD